MALKHQLEYLSIVSFGLSLLVSALYFLHGCLVYRQRSNLPRSQQLLSLRYRSWFAVLVITQVATSLGLRTAFIILILIDDGHWAVYLSSTIVLGSMLGQVGETNMKTVSLLTLVVYLARRCLVRGPTSFPSDNATFRSRNMSCTFHWRHSFRRGVLGRQHCGVGICYTISP